MIQIQLLTTTITLNLKHPNSHSDTHLVIAINTHNIYFNNKTTLLVLSSIVLHPNIHAP